MEAILISCLLFFLIAILYSSVGHAGASGYLAIMGLLSFAPESIKPTSLLLNIAVASIASYKFIKEGYFERKIFLAFIFTSLPLAFIGGYIKIDPYYFKIIAGVFLLISSVLLIVKDSIQTTDTIRPMPIYWGLALGALIGLFSGLIGVGGGIFLSPIILLMRWSTVKKVAGISALFILCNSIMGLGGHLASLQKVDWNIGYYLLSVIVGGTIGSYLATKKFDNKWIIRLLFLVLLSAGLKFLLIDIAK